MANLIIQENDVARTRPAVNGEEITIKTPCDCSAVTGVQINGVAFPFYDATGHSLENITGLFAQDSLVRVMIDTDNTRAYILNADTNAYLEGRFEELEEAAANIYQGDEEPEDESITIWIDTDDDTGDTPHAHTHAVDGEDPLTPDMIGAYTKEETLSPSTKAALGLSEDAVPDDAFNGLANVSNHYVWQKNKVDRYEKQTNTAYCSLYNYSSATTENTVVYCDSITIDTSTGKIVGVNPTTITGDYAIISGILDIIKGKYIYLAKGATLSTETFPNWFYIPSDANTYSGLVGNYYQVYAGAGNATLDASPKIVTVESEWEVVGYVNNPNANAYPPEEFDGYTYTERGLFGDGAKIVTGSYVGTGTYGASNPNSLSFERTPKMVILLGFSDSSNTLYQYFGTEESGNYCYYIPTILLTTTYARNFGFRTSSSSGYSYAKISADGKTVSWYNTNDAIYQCNYFNYTYYYLAIL